MPVMKGSVGSDASDASDARRIKQGLDKRKKAEAPEHAPSGPV